MKLTVFNGSPRGKGGNTRVLLDHFVAGFEASGENTHELFYLNRVKESARFQKAFEEAEQVLLAFPLYTDCMPAQVKAFIESLQPFCGRQGNPPIGFIVQSGFPEANNSRYVEKYLEKLAARLGCAYMGTVIKGGGENIRESSGRGRKKLLGPFYQLGKTLGESGQFDAQLVRKLAEPERLSKLFIVIFKLLAKTGLTESYWNNMLKENDAFEKRFAKPYVE